jgi:hypothetical protein
MVERGKLSLIPKNALLKTTVRGVINLLKRPYHDIVVEIKESY